MVMLLYIVIYPLAKRYFSLTWRYQILKIAMFFYLVPFAYYKYSIISRVHMAVPQLIDRLHPTPPRLNGLKTRYIPLHYRPADIPIPEDEACLHKPLRPTPSPKWDYAFREMKSKLGIKKNIRLYCSESCKSPMTVGTLAPVIFLPLGDGEGLDDISCQYIIKHELIHIKHKDFLIRFMGLAVIAVHWFNPFSYLLYYELSNTLEMLCDRAVLEGCKKKEPEAYGRLLINLAAGNIMANEKHLFVGITNHKNKIDLKRRILEMKANRKNRFLLSMAAMGLIFMAGGITAFAYVPPNTITDKEEDGTETFDYTFIPEGEKNEEVSLYMPYDYFFIDSDGNVTELPQGQPAQKEDCTHNYVISGTIKKHIKNSDGGCMVKEFEAQTCSVCEDIESGQLIGTYIYPKCPH